MFVWYLSLWELMFWFKIWDNGLTKYGPALIELTRGCSPNSLNFESFELDSDSKLELKPDDSFNNNKRIQCTCVPYVALSSRTNKIKEIFKFIIHETIHDQMKIDWFEFNLCFRLRLRLPLYHCLWPNWQMHIFYR